MRWLNALRQQKSIQVDRAFFVFIWVALFAMIIASLIVGIRHDNVQRKIQTMFTYEECVEIVQQEHKMFWIDCEEVIGMTGEELNIAYHFIGIMDKHLCNRFEKIHKTKKGGKVSSSQPVNENQLECTQCGKKEDGIELFTPVRDGLLCEKCYLQFSKPKE